MARQFQFRLMGGGAPDGELEAGVLIEVVRALQAIAVRLGRRETGSQRLGRLRHETRRVVTLLIGVHGAGTRLTWRRMPDRDSLGFDMPHESAFDDAFEELIIALAHGVRPEWVDDPLAENVNSLLAGLDRAAETVRFSSGDDVRATFTPGHVDQAMWGNSQTQEAQSNVSENDHADMNDRTDGHEPMTSPWR